MGKGRLEAFSDGVLAVALTIMVLDLKAPHSADPTALREALPDFLSYVLSFVYIGIYWNNHHHLLHTAKQVAGGMMWANLHLLFWLTLVPFTTAWISEHHLEAAPVALYGFVLLMAGVAYTVLQRVIIACHGGRDSELHQAVGHDVKGKLSIVSYGAAIGLAFVEPVLSEVIYALVALMWLVPDTRIQRRVHP